MRLTEAVTDSGEGWTTYAALAGGDRAGAVVEQNTAAFVSAEESKLCAVCPFKASSLTLHWPGHVCVQHHDLVQPQAAVLLLEH